MGRVTLINLLDAPLQTNITITPLELIAVKQAVVDQMIGYVLVGLYVFFVVGLIFGYQYCKYRMKKNAEEEVENDS